MMNYPIEIIPKSYYSRRIDLEKVLAHSGCFYVCRTVYSPIEDIISEDFDGNKILDIDAFKEHVVGLSVNMMGGHYNESHLVYFTRMKHPSSEDWKGQTIKLTDFVGGFDRHPQAYPIYYSSEVLHRQPVRHSFFKPDKGRKQSLKESFGDSCDEIFGDEWRTQCEIFIAHKPTNLNYWHMQLEMKPALEDDDKSFKNDKAWRKDIYAQLISDILTKKFMLSLPASCRIVNCAYCGISTSCRQFKR